MLLYAPLILNNTSNSIFLPLYALNIFLQRYKSACVINCYFLTLKCVFSSRLYSSTRYIILLATSNLRALPSIRRSKIDQQLFIIIQSPCFSFYSIIFIIFYSYSTFPILSNLVKSYIILSPSIGHSSLYTRARRLSLPSALSRLTLNTIFLTLSFIVNTYSSQLYLPNASSSLYNSRARKNAYSSSSIISQFSIVYLSLVPTFLIEGTYANKAIIFMSRYLATFYILLLLSRNSSQYYFQYY